MIILASDNIDTLTTWGTALRNTYPISIAASLGELLHKLTGASPECVAFDRNLAPGELQETIKQIRKANAETKILLLTTPGHPHSDQEDLNLLKAGIRGFCTADMDSELILKVMSAVSQGQIWIRNNLIPLLIEELSKQSKVAIDPPAAISEGHAAGSPSAKGTDILNLLTPREREIAAMVGQGECNKRIAQYLKISEQTVKAHLTVIFRKLNVTDRVHLALRIAQG